MQTLFLCRTLQKEVPYLIFLHTFEIFFQILKVNKQRNCEVGKIIEIKGVEFLPQTPIF